MIEFLCPNGHRISCPADQAGQAAKCPRCDVRFRVPEPTEPIPQDASTEEHVEVSQQPEPAPPSVTPVSEPQIEFLCPNGHKLHGPRSLQGQPGECPECESKFRIPTFDEPSESEEESEPQAVETPPSSEPSEPSTISVHPLASLFSKLWSEKPTGTTVKLFLADGETLIPNRFAESLSQQNHGVFAVVEPGGTHTLTVVAWDSVVRAEVQGVKQLPKEMAE